MGVNASKSVFVILQVLSSSILGLVGASPTSTTIISCFRRLTLPLPLNHVDVVSRNRSHPFLSSFKLFHNLRSRYPPSSSLFPDASENILILNSVHQCYPQQSSPTRRFKGLNSIFISPSNIPHFRTIDATLHTPLFSKFFLTSKFMFFDVMSLIFLLGWGNLRMGVIHAKIMTKSRKDSNYIHYFL